MTVISYLWFISGFVCRIYCLFSRTAFPVILFPGVVWLWLRGCSRLRSRTHTQNFWLFVGGRVNHAPCLPSLPLTVDPVMPSLAPTDIPCGQDTTLRTCGYRLVDIDVTLVWTPAPPDDTVTLPTLQHGTALLAPTTPEHQLPPDWARLVGRWAISSQAWLLVVGILALASARHLQTHPVERWRFFCYLPDVLHTLLLLPGLPLRCSVSRLGGVI